MFSELFYLCIFFMLFCSAGVVFSKNALHSILFLAACFFFSSMTIFLLENEFLALFFLIIYLGAILILFLFVVMMLDLKQNLLKVSKTHLPVGFTIVVFLFWAVWSNFATMFSGAEIEIFGGGANARVNWYSFLDDTADTFVLSKMLYTAYAPQLVVSGVLLFVSVVGVVFLTTNGNRKFSSKSLQLLTRQISRRNVL